MRFRWIPTFLLALAATPLSAQQPDSAAAAADAVPVPDTASVPDGAARDGIAGGDALAGPDSTPARVRLRMPPLPGTDSAWVRLGYLRVPLDHRDLTARIERTRVQPAPYVDRTGALAVRMERLLEARVDTLWRRVSDPVELKGKKRRVVVHQPTAVVADTVQYLPLTDEEQDTTENALPDAVSQYAQLGMQVSGSGEMASSWESFAPCDASSGLESCDGGLLPQFRPDIRFGALVGGTVTDRIHVAVDYDQRREFDASNNINVYYQGLEDEMLQRVEVGDVAIQLPQSSFMTAGVPGGNFGFKALAQVGPLEFQSIWAQQKGDIGSTELTVDGAGSGEVYDEQSIVLDDYGYVSGRFFFLVDPAELPGYPHIDVLELAQSDAPPELRPTGATLQLYRDDQINPQQQTGAQYFHAQAIGPAGTDTVSGNYRRLDPGDYVVHSSGLWIMLRQPLGETESIALAYVTAAGDTVGTLNAGQQGGDDERELRLLRGPTSYSHFPGAPTWEYEMHQVYSIYAGDIDERDIELDITLGDQTQGRTYVEWQGRQVPWIRLFGLDEAQPSDQVDEDRIYRPARNSQGAQPINGTFLVFPTLRPFADPPAVPSEEMTAEDALTALGDDRTTRIYDERDPDLRESGRFRLGFSYRVQTDGLRSEFALGAFGIREGSEKIRVDGQALRRGEDYEIDYETGIVRLVDPQSVFAGRGAARITADFEQNALFQVAPKTLFGATAKYGLGEVGELNLVGLYQGEKALMSRPQLGSEPSSAWMGGVTGDLRFGAGWMDRLLDDVPGLRLGGESSIALTGELAMSAPNPNTRGMAWLDDFEASAEIPLSLNRRAWRLGSKPATTLGDGGLMPAVLDPSNAFELVWQDQVVTAAGQVAGAFPPRLIDEQINTQGRTAPEPILYLTANEDPNAPADERVWRSLTTVLSPRGMDLSSTEFLEFYVSEVVSGDMTFVIDIGTVGEDAYYIDEEGALSGVDPETSRPWGLGVLDQEANFADGEIWSRELDQRGLWGQDCVVEPGEISLRGDARANCTVNNGVNDTEDLNNNGVPDLEDGRHFRYVVELGSDADSRYLVRDRSETGTQFRLYRIPLRGPLATAVNGADDNTWRSIQHMRITVTSDRCGGNGNFCRESLYLARMRLIGSRWNKRNVHGVLSGRTDTTSVIGQQVATLEVGPVSQITEGGRRYSPPPGVTEEANDPSASFNATGIETNEKALRVRYTDLAPRSRGEIYYRFPQNARSLMQYRELRLWALPRDGDWGPGGTHELLVKLGTDDGNYYLYRTPLRPPTTQVPVVRESWLPEVVIDFEPWLELKAEAERRVLTADSIGADGIRIWNEDSTYAIVLKDRSQAPNMDAIRDLSFAVYNGAGVPADGELWLNDFRLSGARRDGDFAGTVGVTAQLSDFANVRVSMSNRGALFQQIGRDATYQASEDFGISSRLELGHLAPAGWGLNMPLTVQHTRSAQDPVFLSNSDIEARRLEGLRESGSDRTQLGLALSKSTPSANALAGLLLDGSSLSLNYTTLDNRTFVSSTDEAAFSGTYGYQHQLQERSVDVTPDFLVGLMRALVPAALERSEFFQRMSTADLRWSPTSVDFSTTYYDRSRMTRNYAAVIESPRDSAFAPIESPMKGLDQSAGIGFQPFRTLTARVGASSSRDLLSPERSSRRALSQQAIEHARGGLAGVDLGWERNRSLSSSVQFTPFLSEWLRPAITVSTRYGTSRSPNNLNVIEDADGDSIARMQRNFDIQRDVSRTLRFDAAGLVNSFWGAEPAPDQGWLTGALRGALGALQPVDFSWTTTRESAFEREDFEPGYGYRLGLGGMGGMRFLRGDTAELYRDREAIQVRSALRARGAELRIGFNRTDQMGLNAQGGDNIQDETTWPDLQLSLRSVPIPSLVEPWLSNVSASTGFRRTETGQAFGTGQRSSVNNNVPVQLSATFANGFSVGYNGALGWTRGRQTTGGTRGDDMTHDFSVRGHFPAPGFLGEKVESDIDATLRYSYRSQLQCKLVVGQDGNESCPPWSDNLNRMVDMTLQTIISGIDVGMQFRFNDRQSFIGLRNSERQFQFGIFGQFNMGVGTMPEDMANRATGTYK